MSTSQNIIPSFFAEFAINDDFFWFTEWLEDYTRGIEYRKILVPDGTARLLPARETSNNTWSLTAVMVPTVEKAYQMGSIIEVRLFPFPGEHRTKITAHVDETAPIGFTQVFYEILAAIAARWVETRPVLLPLVKQNRDVLAAPNPLATIEEVDGRRGLLDFVDGFGELIEIKPNPDREELKKRVLFLVSEGYKQDQIAKAVNKPPRTVQRLIKDLKNEGRLPNKRLP